MARVIAILLLCGTLAGCRGAEAEGSTTTIDIYPHRAEAVALVEDFLEAFYAPDQGAMLATLAPTAMSRDFAVYFQGWTTAAGTSILSREPCEFHEGGVTGHVTCAVTVEDDLMRAVGLGNVPATDTFTVYLSDDGIEKVEIASNDRQKLDEGIAWVFGTYPELQDHERACWAIFNGGPTPEACAAAVAAALAEYPGP